MTVKIVVTPTPWSLGARSVCRLAGVPVKVLFAAKREVLCFCHIPQPSDNWGGQQAFRSLVLPVSNTLPCELDAWIVAKDGLRQFAIPPLPAIMVDEEQGEDGGADVGALTRVGAST
jgi:hypothetical protein